MRVWISGIGLEHKDAIETHSQFGLQLIEKLSKDIALIGDINDEQAVMQAGLNPNEVVSISF